MELYWFVIVFVFGAIIGSFLNVVIYRLHTGRSLNGRSHCMTCGTHLRWFELFPVFSYVILLAKCRYCRAFIPSRYLLVEMLTGISFVLLWQSLSHNLVLFGLYGGLISTLIIILLYDIRHTIIPDELTVIVGIFTLMILGYEYIEYRDLATLIYDVLGGMSAGLFFAGLWYVSRGRWIGLGDAKLALPLAIIVGYNQVFSMVVLSFWVGAIVSLTILSLQHLLERWKTHLPYLTQTITMKSEVPFAPFLIAGFLLAHFFHADIFDITNSLLFF